MHLKYAKMLAIVVHEKIPTFCVDILVWEKGNCLYDTGRKLRRPCQNWIWIEPEIEPVIQSQRLMQVFQFSLVVKLSSKGEINRRNGY